MTIPALLLGLLISTFLGVAFHLWRGGGLGHLIFFVIMGWIGFWVGQLIGEWLGFTFFSYGPLHLGTAIIACLLFLTIARWLGKTMK